MDSIDGATPRVQVHDRSGGQRFIIDSRQTYRAEPGPIATFTDYDKQGEDIAVSTHHNVRYLT